MNPHLFKKREVGKLGLPELWWVKTDSGGFSGPLEDWINESPTWMSFVKDYSTVVQAGGLCGMYPMLYSNLFDMVYTFEPSKYSFTCLAANTGDIKNIIAINAALGIGNQLMGIVDSNDSNIGTHFMEHEHFLNADTNAPKIIPTFKIDQLALTSCGLIHLDIEGSEDLALAGAIETIQKFRPTIITEQGRGHTLLENMGYRRVWQGSKDCVFTYQGIIL